MNLVLFDFDKTIVNRDTGAAYMKTKYIGFSILLWLTTFGMSLKKVIHLRRTFIRRYLNESSTIIFKDAVQHLQLHSTNTNQVVVVSGASEWVVKAIFTQASLPRVEFVCSEEIRFFGGMVSKFHCYASNKVERVRKLYNLGKYNSIIGYSDSSVDIPILTLCNSRYIVNPKTRCLRQLSKSFNNTMVVLNWA